MDTLAMIYVLGIPVCALYWIYVVIKNRDSGSLPWILTSVLWPIVVFAAFQSWLDEYFIKHPKKGVK